MEYVSYYRDIKKLPNRLLPPKCNLLENSINVCLEMIKARGYKVHMEIDTKSLFRIYKHAKEERYVILIPLSLIEVDAIPKDTFVRLIMSIIEAYNTSICITSIIFISYLQVSGFVQSVMDILALLQTSDSQELKDQLEKELPNTVSSKGKYKLAKEWLLQIKPLIEWYEVSQMCLNIGGLIPMHSKDTSKDTSPVDTLKISKDELIVRYNGWKIGDIVSIRRKGEHSVRREVV